MTLTSNQQLELGFKSSSPTTLDVNTYPTLVTWITQLMPELLDQSNRSRLTLEAILFYLFKDKKGSSLFCLEEILNEELYFCLLGLKSILKEHHHNWGNVVFFLEEHQRLSLPTYEEFPLHSFD